MINISRAASLEKLRITRVLAYLLNCLCFFFQKMTLSFACIEKLGHHMNFGIFGYLVPSPYCNY